MADAPPDGDRLAAVRAGDGGMNLANEIINGIAREYGWPAFVPETLQ